MLQKDGTSCGPWVVCYVEQILKNWPFPQEELVRLHYTKFWTLIDAFSFQSHTSSVPPFLSGLNDYVDQLRYTTVDRIVYWMKTDDLMPRLPPGIPDSPAKTALQRAWVNQYIESKFKLSPQMPIAIQSKHKSNVSMS